MAERPEASTEAAGSGGERPRGYAYLRLAYLYPALLLGLALGSGLLAYMAFADFIVCDPRTRVGCPDFGTYYGFEGVMFGLLGLLSLSAVRRARRGKDLWTMQVYWPAVLGVFATFGLILYAVTVTSARGCAPGYFLWGCWDQGVTVLRVTLALLATGGFTFGIARWIGGPLRRRIAVADAAGSVDDAADADAAEEISAR